MNSVVLVGHRGLVGLFINNKFIRCQGLRVPISFVPLTFSELPLSSLLSPLSSLYEDKEVAVYLSCSSFVLFLSFSGLPSSTPSILLCATCAAFIFPYLFSSSLSRTFVHSSKPYLSFEVLFIRSSGFGLMYFSQCQRSNVVLQ